MGDAVGDYIHVGTRVCWCTAQQRPTFAWSGLRTMPASVLEYSGIVARLCASRTRRFTKVAEILYKPSQKDRCSGSLRESQRPCESVRCAFRL